ncbi:MAG: hypothetical protein NC177_14945 [Ruminococcus flavefaciens]|nr:hypothetical protein [Ruminococcus flavefaciens]
MVNDTVHLLKECDSGTKTAVNSIREVLDNVKNEHLLEILTDSLKEHEAIGNETNEMLGTLGEDGKDPNPMARAASWMKINVKLFDDPSDETIAALMTDGCNMGIKQLGIYKNKYPTADRKAQRLAEKLIKEEESLLDELRRYL